MRLMTDRRGFIGRITAGLFGGLFVSKVSGAHVSADELKVAARECHDRYLEWGEALLPKSHTTSYVITHDGHLYLVEDNSYKFYKLPTTIEDRI